MGEEKRYYGQNLDCTRVCLKDTQTSKYPLFVQRKSGWICIIEAVSPSVSHLYLCELWFDTNHPNQQFQAAPIFAKGSLLVRVVLLWLYESP